MTIIQHLSPADTDSVLRPVATPIRRTLQRMSDKCSGGGIIWPRAVFRTL